MNTCVNAHAYFALRVDCVSSHSRTFGRVKEIEWSHNINNYNARLYRPPGARGKPCAHVSSASERQLQLRVEHMYYRYMAVIYCVGTISDECEIACAIWEFRHRTLLIDENTQHKWRLFISRSFLRNISYDRIIIVADWEILIVVSRECRSRVRFWTQHTRELHVRLGSV